MALVSFYKEETTQFGSISITFCCLSLSPFGLECGCKWLKLQPSKKWTTNQSGRAWPERAWCKEWDACMYTHSLTLNTILLWLLQSACPYAASSHLSWGQWPETNTGKCILTAGPRGKALWARSNSTTDFWQDFDYAWNYEMLPFPYQQNKKEDKNIMV